MGRLLGENEAARTGGREDDAAWSAVDIPPTASQQYFLSKVLSYLDRGGDINCTSLSPVGHTLLMSACINNHEVLVAELVARGAALDVKAKGKTALHFSCLLAHPNCAKPLLDSGARTDIQVDEDDTDYTECDGMTALEIVREKLIGARDPIAERLRTLEKMLPKS